MRETRVMSMKVSNIQTNDKRLTRTFTSQPSSSPENVTWCFIGSYGALYVLRGSEVKRRRERLVIFLDTVVQMQ